MTMQYLYILEIVHSGHVINIGGIYMNDCIWLHGTAQCVEIPTRGTIARHARGVVMRIEPDTEVGVGYEDAVIIDRAAIHITRSTHRQRVGPYVISHSRKVIRHTLDIGTVHIEAIKTAAVHYGQTAQGEIVADIQISKSVGKHRQTSELIV
jgi:hypothetical protein